MPEFGWKPLLGVRPERILYSTVRSKSWVIKPSLIRNVLPRAGCYLVVSPVMVPSSTLQYSGFPFQPLSVLPSNRFCVFGSAAANGRGSPNEEATAAATQTTARG